MSERKNNPALRAKASVDSSTQQHPKTSSKNQTIRRCIMQSAEKELGLQLTPKSDDISQFDLNNFLDGAETDGLILVLDGSDGRRGAIILNTGLVGAVIETITIGHLSGATPIARKMTRTDAAIVAPLVDDIMSRLDGGASPDDIWSGYRFGATAPDLHSLGNLLDDVPYSVTTLEFQIADIAYPLSFQLAFPILQNPVDAGKATGADWADSFRSKLYKTQVSVPVALCRVQLPIETVQSFSEGFFLTLPGNALQNASLIAGGESIACGQLGKLNGQRALKLISSPKPQPSVTQTSSQSAGSDAVAQAERKGEVVVL